MRGKLSHGADGRPLERVLHHGHVGVAAGVPGIVLFRAQIDPLERSGDARLIAEQGEVEGGGAIIRAEGYVEAMLGIAGFAAEAAANA